MVALGVIVITTLLCTALAGLAYLKKVLTWDGSLAAFAVGFIIGIFGDILWLFLLLLFLVTSFAATRYRFEEKRAIGLQEGIQGERRYSNVLANGLAPTFVAMISFFNGASLPKPLSGLLFVSAISVAASDTLASELGVLSSKTYCITTFKRVRPGTNGGVSMLGQGAALLAAIYTTAMAWLFLYFLPPAVGLSITFPSSALVLGIPIVVGFLGCQIDSVVGATLETKGLVSKKTNNLLSTSLGAAMAYGLYLLVA
ncbi:MAG: TIGR00297 family protein [Thermoplasmata archaeon]